MEEAAAKNLEVVPDKEIYYDLALLPQVSAAADNDLNEQLHDDAIPLLAEGTEDWTEFDLLAAFTGPV